MTTDVAIGSNGRGNLSAHQVAQLGAAMAIQGMTRAKVQEVTHAIEAAATQAAVASTEVTMAAMAEAHDANLLRLAEAIRQLPDAPPPRMRDLVQGVADRRGFVDREAVLLLVAGLQSAR